MEFFKAEKDKNDRRQNFDNSIGKRSRLCDVDELIDWAEGLPDDVEISGSPNVATFIWTIINN